LRAWKREQDDATPYVFTSLRGGPMTRRTVHHVVAEGAKAAGIEFPVHPHMLRHATGFYLANAGQDTRAIQLYLGHKNIQHTVRYTELAPAGSRISGRTDQSDFADPTAGLPEELNWRGIPTPRGCRWAGRTRPRFEPSPCFCVLSIRSLAAITTLTMRLRFVSRGQRATLELSIAIETVAPA
jgi:Phage integrase family